MLAHLKIRDKRLTNSIMKNVFCHVVRIPTGKEEYRKRTRNSFRRHIKENPQKKQIVNGKSKCVLIRRCLVYEDKNIHRGILCHTQKRVILGKGKIGSSKKIMKGWR